jgi:hypothetical protein
MIVNFFFQIAQLTFFAKFYRDFIIAGASTTCKLVALCAILSAILYL